MKKFVGFLLVLSAVLLLTVACQMGESADEAIVVGRGLYEEKDFAAWANKGGYAFLRNDIYLTESYVVGVNDNGTPDDESDDFKVTTPYSLDLRGHKLVFCDSTAIGKEAGVEKKTAKKPAKAKVTVPAEVTLTITNSEPENPGTGIESVSTNNGSEETKFDNGTLFDIQGGKLAIEDTPIQTDGGGDPVIIVSGGGDLDIKKSSIDAGGDPSGEDGTKKASPVLQVEALPDKGEDTGDGGQDKKSEINLDETEIKANTTPVNIVPDPDAGTPAEGKGYVAPEISFKGGSTVENKDTETNKSPINNEVGADIKFEDDSEIVIPDGGNCPQEEKSGTNTRTGGFYRMKNAPALVVTGKTKLTLSNYTIVSTYDSTAPVAPTIIVDGTGNDTDSPTTLILDNCLVLGEGTAIEVKGNALLVTGVNQGESYGTDTPDSYSAQTTNINVQNGTRSEYDALDPVEKGDIAAKYQSAYLTGTGILVANNAKAILANANVHIGLSLTELEGGSSDPNTHLYKDFDVTTMNVGVTAVGGNVELRDNINISNAAIAMNILSGSTVTDNTTEDHVLTFEGSEHAWYVEDSTVEDITKIDFVSHNNHAFTAYGSEIGNITDCTFTQDATTDNESIFAINLGLSHTDDSKHTSVGVISHTMAGDKDTNVYDSESTLYSKAPVIEVTEPTISGPNGICLDFADIESIQNEWINVTGKGSETAYDGIALNSESYISIGAYELETDEDDQTGAEVIVFSDESFKDCRSVVKVTLPEKGLGNAVSFAPKASLAAGASFQNSVFEGGKKSFDIGNYEVNGEVVGLFLKDCYAKAADYCLYADTTSDIQINGGEFIVVNNRTNNAPLYMTSNVGASSRLTLENGIVLFPNNIGIDAVKSRPGIKLSSMRSDKTSAIKADGGIVNIKPETLIYSTGASDGVDYYLDVSGTGRAAIGNEVEFWGAHGHDHLHTSAAHYDGWYNYYYYLSYTKPWVSTETSAKLHARHVVAAGVGGGGVVVAVTVYGQVINDKVDTTVWATVEDWNEIEHEVTERHDGSFQYNADLTRHYFKVDGGYGIEDVYGYPLEYTNYDDTQGYLSRIAVYYSADDHVGTPGKIKVGSLWYTNDFEDSSYEKSAVGSYENPLGLYTFLGAANGGYFCAGAVECVYNNQTNNYVFNEETQRWVPYKETEVRAPKYVVEECATSIDETGFTVSLTCDTNGVEIYYRDITNKHIKDTYRQDVGETKASYHKPTYGGVTDLGPYIRYDEGTTHLKVNNQYEFFAIKFPNGYKAPKFILDEYTGFGKVVTKNDPVAAVIDGDYYYMNDPVNSDGLDKGYNYELFYYFSKETDDAPTFLILREKDDKGNPGTYSHDENIKMRNLEVGGKTYNTPGALCDWRLFYPESKLVEKTITNRHNAFTCIEIGEVLSKDATTDDSRRDIPDTFNLRNGATVGRSEVVIYTASKESVSTPVASFSQGRYLSAGVSTKDATLSYKVLLKGLTANDDFVATGTKTKDEVIIEAAKNKTGAWTSIESTESKDLWLEDTASAVGISDAKTNDGRGIKNFVLFGSNYPDLKAYVVVKASKETMEDSYIILTLERTPQPVIGTVEMDANSGALSVTVSSPTDKDVEGDNLATPAAGSYTLGYVLAATETTKVNYKSDASSGKISKAGDKITGTVAIPDGATGDLVVQAYLLNNSNALPSAVNTFKFVVDAAPTVEPTLYLGSTVTFTAPDPYTVDKSQIAFGEYKITDNNTGAMKLYYSTNGGSTYTDVSIAEGATRTTTVSNEISIGAGAASGSVTAYAYGGEDHIKSPVVTAGSLSSVSVTTVGNANYFVVPIPAGYTATVYGDINITTTAEGSTLPTIADISAFSSYTSTGKELIEWNDTDSPTVYYEKGPNGELRLPIFEVGYSDGSYPSGTNSKSMQTYYKVVLTKSTGTGTSN